jgi:ferric-dicitrate binding protein FerR (iron transport regulator)
MLANIKYMDKRYLLQLLRKYLNGNATPEEKKFVGDYYNTFSGENDVMATFTSAEREALENELVRNIFGSVPHQKFVDPKVKPMNRKYWKVAAAALVFSISITSGYVLFNKPEVKSASQPVAVQANTNRVFFLADGSSVILSAGSRLNYPSSFDGMRKREVYLEGQAFFDIQHNDGKPFIVHTGDVTTTVLGTAFNVRAMPGESNITVTVNRGKVKVANKQTTLGVITPRQQITFDKQRVTSNMQLVKTDSYMEWKDETLLFDNLTIAEAAKLLEEKFRTDIVISDQSLSSQRFTASFPKNESLEEALNSICVFNRVHYSYNDDRSQITITKN